jgi:hypothetical protein
MLVQLTHSEMMHAAVVGIMRNIQNLRDNRRPRYGAGVENDWQIHVEGALGEYALAKQLGIFFSGAHTFGSTDVGQWQVRTSTRSDGSLILHPTDADDDRFVLVTGINGSYAIRGWIYGHEGKRDEWWRDPTGKGRPAFFVPQSALHPMSD